MTVRRGPRSTARLLRPGCPGRGGALPEDDSEFDIDEFIASSGQPLKDSRPALAVRELVERAVSRPAGIDAALGRAKSWRMRTIYSSDDPTILGLVRPPRVVRFPHDHGMRAADGSHDPSPHLGPVPGVVGRVDQHGDPGVAGHIAGPLALGNVLTRSTLPVCVHPGQQGLRLAVGRAGPEGNPTRSIDRSQRPRLSQPGAGGTEPPPVLWCQIATIPALSHHRTMGWGIGRWVGG